MQLAMARQAEPSASAGEVISAAGQSGIGEADRGRGRDQRAPDALTLRYLRRCSRSPAELEHDHLPDPIDLIRPFIHHADKEGSNNGALRENPLTGERVLWYPAGRPAGRDRAHGAGRKPGHLPVLRGPRGLTPPELAAYGRHGGGPDEPGWTVRVVPNNTPPSTGRRW